MAFLFENSDLVKGLELPPTNGGNREESVGSLLGRGGWNKSELLMVEQKGRGRGNEHSFFLELTAEEGIIPCVFSAT